MRFLSLLLVLLPAYDLVIAKLPSTSGGRSLDPFTLAAISRSATYSVANQLGFFTAQRLNVTFVLPPNSTFGYAQLLSGGYDILIGTFDNAVDLRFNHDLSLSVAGMLDMGPDMVLASVPSITSVSQLKGKPVMVDAPNSAFALALIRILSLYGLSSSDYTFQAVGATSIRFANLKAGALPNGTAVYATTLIYPFTTESSTFSPPPNILARFSDFINPYATAAITVRSSAPTDTVIRAMAALSSANTYLADPHNAHCATLAISRELNVTVDIAKKEYEAATNAVSGETTSPGVFNVSRPALMNVLDLRALAGGFAGAGTEFNFVDAISPGPEKFIDYSARDAALKIKLAGPKFCPL